jgi:hypothetical protein
MTPQDELKLALAEQLKKDSVNDPKVTFGEMCRRYRERLSQHTQRPPGATAPLTG